MPNYTRLGQVRSGMKAGRRLAKGREQSRARKGKEPKKWKESKEKNIYLAMLQCCTHSPKQTVTRQRNGLKTWYEFVTMLLCCKIDNIIYTHWQQPVCVCGLRVCVRVCGRPMHMKLQQLRGQHNKQQLQWMLRMWKTIHIQKVREQFNTLR